ncbi:MAG: DEAD/DEAH box helicase [Desulfuromonas sp. SDB]|nr:MAG: DEAD/DEAH box helicase [Desulfuromonas sp. SDB]
MSKICENDIERMTLELLEEQGYLYKHGPAISPDGKDCERDNYSQVILKSRLLDTIEKINPKIPSSVLLEVVKKIQRMEELDLVSNNEAFHRLLTDGVNVEYKKNDRVIGDSVKLIDFSNPEKNEFLAVNQFTVIENNNNKRPDIILFINGIPLVVIELKNPADESATVLSAYKQLQTYKSTIPSLFHYNGLLVISDGQEAKAGSLTAKYQRFMVWKSIEGKREASKYFNELEVLIQGCLNKKVLLDLIRHFTVFEKTSSVKEDLKSAKKVKQKIITVKTEKKIAAYHQYFAVNKAIKRTKTATSPKGDRRCGVIWHSQGSGKSLSMVFYTGKLVLELDNPTVVVLTDRNDLDDQLFDTFAGCNQLLRQKPVQAESRDDLKEKLKVAAGGIIFTTIQKFFPEDKGDKYPELSNRRNIIVIADEAHRSQYDFIDGFARHMRDALPNASFISFTGTPIEKEDRNTRAVFGDYIDIYDIEQSIDDKSTVKIYYESRMVNIDLKEEEKEKLDERLDEVLENVEPYGQDRIKSKWARLEAVVGNENRLRKVAEDIVNHFEQRLEVFEGKALIVCMSRRICIDLYNEITRLRPSWHDEDDDKGLIKVIMTGSSSDPIDWQPHIRNKERRRAIGDRVKDPFDPLRVILVRDMWLTGFDAPCLHTMYVDKPMRGHNLMQAIARVNRVFGEKPGGLIVDYIGIASDLKKALSTYTESGGRGKPTLDQAEAVALMMEKYEIVSQMFYEFNYQDYFNLETSDRLNFIREAEEYVLGLEDGKQRFTREVMMLSKAFALSVPHPQALKIRDDVGFFQALRARLLKFETVKAALAEEEVESVIKQIISQAVVTDKVIDVFDAAGIKKPDISILSDEFLAEVRGMKHKNVAVEFLRKLLNDEIKERSVRNLILSKKFMEMLEQAINRYKNKILTSAEVIQELMDLAKDIRKSDKRKDKLKLNDDELAFYDALADNENAVEVLGDEVLGKIARELVDKVKKSATIDWTIKESVRAKLRVLVRRTLRKYKYPPDKQERATQTVLKQAELLANIWVKERIK